MNVLIQIGLGIFMTFITFLVICLMHKKNKRVILELICFMFIMGVGCIVGGVYFVKNDYVTDLSQRSKRVESQCVSEMALHMAKKGEYEAAKKMLQDASEGALYSMDYPLCLAKIEAMQGNNRSALALYQKVLQAGEKVSDSQENMKKAIEKLSLVAQSEQNDTALLNSGVFENEFTVRDKSGQNKTLNTADELNKIQQKKEKENEVKKYFITQNHTNKTDNNSKSYEKMAELVLSIEECYEKKLFDQIQNSELSKIEKQYQQLLEQCPEMQSIDIVRYTRIKMAVLQNDYNKLVKNINEYTDYKEYMVIANLFLNGYISKEAFVKKIGDNLADMYEKVADQLESVFQNNKKNLSKTAQKDIGQYVRTLRNSAKNPVMGQINNQLTDYVASGVKDSTKIYLLQAQIAQKDGNQSASENYLSRAMNTVGNCEDSLYTEPMGKLISLITNKENSNDVKNIPTYVDEVLKNQYIIDISENDLNKKSKSSFDSYFTDYVSQKRVSIHITDVDYSQFENLKVKFNVDDQIVYSEQDLKEMLGVQDCGIDITDFKIKKVNYDHFYTLLCCDTSGSMEGEAIENLKSAVSLFAENKEKKDVLGLVEFNDAPTKILKLGSSVEQIKKESRSISASGGTNMYDTAISSINMINGGDNSLKTIILMSDGADNNKRTVDEINKNIGECAKEKNVVIYTIGLGQEVDSDYLSSIAECTGGSYIYVNDSHSLYEFYRRLNNQNKNQYVLTYKAQDTFTNTDRECRLNLNQDELTYASYVYNLTDGENGETEMLDGKMISGLESRLIFKSDTEQTNELLGTGFNKGELIRVKMMGNAEYDLKAQYVSETEYALRIPANVACGTYDILVQINGKKAYLKNELTIAVQGSQKTTIFGQYQFTSFSKVETTDCIKLSGYVRMNNWFNFNGDVVLKGNISGENVILSDASGGYVKYNKDNSYWLGRYMANNNISMPIMPLGDVTLYNDAGSTFNKDFRVTAVNVATTSISKLIELNEPVLRLYPDRIELDVNQFATKLDEQYNLFDGDKNKISSVFTFQHSEKVVVTGQNLGVNFRVTGGDEEAAYRELYIGNIPLHFNNKNIEFTLNSAAGVIDFKYIAKLAYLNMDGAGFSIKMKTTDNEIKLNEVGFYLDQRINFNIQGIQCSLADFKLVLGDLDKGGPTKWIWKGGTDINAGDISSVLPKLEKYFGNVTVFSMDDAQIEGRICDPYLKFTTTFKIFDSFTLGNLRMTFGNFTYANELLAMNNQEVKGFEGTLSNELKWESKHCDIKLNGKSQISAHDKFIGIQESGSGEIDVNWWIKRKFSSQGEILIGIYRDHSDRINFGIIAQGKMSKGKTNNVSVIWNQDSGIKYENKTF